MADRYEGFEEFVATRGSSLMRTASLMTSHSAAAEDALQETLIRVAMRWPKIMRGGAPEPYVRRVLYSVVVDQWRKNRRHSVELIDGSPQSESPDIAGSASTALVLREALDRLTPRQRAVLVLRYYEDLTEVQTAKVMHCSVSTVKSQTTHALERLRSLSPDLVETFSEVAP